MLDIPRQILIPPFFYKASRVAHQLRVPREMQTPITHHFANQEGVPHMECGDSKQLVYKQLICKTLDCVEKGVASERFGYDLHSFQIYIYSLLTVIILQK